MSGRCRFGLVRPCLALLASLCLPVAAEEGGSGHYLPGSFASFMDGVATEETLIARVNVLNYRGEAAAGLRLPIAGLSAVDAQADSSAVGLTVFWRPAWGEWGGDSGGEQDAGQVPKWSFGMSATLPLVTTDVSAVVSAGPISQPRSDSQSGLGDAILIPLMLNYNVSPDLNLNARLSAYAPTGSYEVGRLANTGKNYWSIEPTIGMVYLGQTNGIEVALYAGIMFNQKNRDTEYRTGNQFHVDATLAQHFPWLGGIAGVGLTGSYYEQLTGDSGEGAIFGDFKARSASWGPVLSFVGKLRDRDLLAEVKWLHETSTRNRFQGDTVFFKAMLSF